MTRHHYDYIEDTHCWYTNKLEYLTASTSRLAIYGRTYLHHHTH